MSSWNTQFAYLWLCGWARLILAVRLMLICHFFASLLVAHGPLSPFMISPECCNLPPVHGLKGRFVHELATDSRKLITYHRVC